MKVLFRLDVGQKYGWGHFFRCKSISQILKNKYGCEVIFLMHFEEGVNYHEINENIVFVKNSSSIKNELNSIIDIVEREEIRILVLDIRTNLSGHDVLEIKKKNIIVASIDDPSERRMFVDYSFYSPLIQLKEVDWNNALGKQFIGWEWMPIRNDFDNLLFQKVEKKKNSFQNLFISMGGSDSLGLIFRVIKALDKKINMKINLIIGISFKQIKSLEKIVEENPNDIKIYVNPEEITKLIANADLAICSFGMTAYELAYCSVKTLYVCISEDHSFSAKTFELSGFGKNLGIHDKLSDEVLKIKINDFIREFQENRNKNSYSCDFKKIDGLAASRISKIVFNGAKDKKC